MDRIFARCVDHIALRGHEGTTLSTAATIALGAPARPAQLSFLARAFSTRRHLFHSDDWSADPSTLRLSARQPLRHRALGYATLEHPALPLPAFQILEHVGRAGPAGVLQSDLSALASLTPVMVSHYLGALSARRLVARKKVVLTTKRPRPGGPATNVTYTSIIVLARHAAHLASTDATTDPDMPAPPPTDDGTPSKTVAEANVDTAVHRVVAALRVPPFIRTQRDLKVVAMPDEERPPAFSKEVWQRRRHRAFRAVRHRLERMGIASVVQRNCVNAAGKPKGVLTCLKLNEAAEGEAEEAYAATKADAAPLVVKEEAEEEEEGVEAGLEEGEGHRDHQGVAAPDDMGIVDDRVPEPEPPDYDEEPERFGDADSTGAHFVAEVDLIEQVYQLLRKSGSQGMSVPELCDYLDGGTGLTSAPQKRIRNIINGIKRVTPIVESQRFEGSAMHLKICLAEFSDMQGVLPSAPNTAIAKISLGDPCDAAPRRPEKSALARKKNELTTLGLQRQELVAKLLQERKAVVMDTLGREVAKLEDTGLHRVDQKVMRRIIDGLVAQQRVNVITTMKPSIKDGSRWQTIRLVVLPHLDASSPEVAQAISSLISRALYGNLDTSHTPQKRKADEEEVVVTIAGENDPTEPKEPMSSTRKKRERQPRRRKASKPKKAPSDETEKGSLNGNDTDREEAGEVGAMPPKPAPSKSAIDSIVVHTELRNARNSRLGRLRAIEHGLMKGRMARVRRFHEKLFRVVSICESDEDEAAPVVQHSTMEVAKEAAPLGTFTVFSCLKELTVGEYAAVVGLFRDYGDLFESVKEERVSDVIDIMQEELLSSQASRQIQNLMQALVRLNLVVSSPDAKWTLCGAGIIRDFGKGMPAGVLPHGIIFSSRRALDAYWKELLQFSHFRYVKVALKDPVPEQRSDHFEDAWAQPLLDVYIRSRWNKGMYSFLRNEQLSYEAVLQRMSGVDVTVNESGRISTANFVVSPLKRFAIEELFDHLHGTDEEPKEKADPQRNGVRIERLLFYSRFRSENEIPSGIYQEQGGEAGAPQEVGGPVIIRLSRGVSEMEVSMIRRATRVSRPSLRKNLTAYNRGLRKQAAAGKKPRPEVPVDVERCVNMIRGIIRRRAVSYCENGGDVPRRKVSMLFATLEGEPLMPHEDTPKGDEAEKETMQFRHAIVTICESGIVQGAIDVLALQLALGVAGDHRGASTSELNKACAALLEQRGDLDRIVRAAMMESEPDLYRVYRLVLKLSENCELRSQEVRIRLMEKEFDLGSNMRFRQGYLLHQQLALLGERYRHLIEAEAQGRLWHGFIFRDEAVDDIWSPGDEDASSVRLELMEQVLTSVLQTGSEVQKSSEVLNLLSRFRERDVANGRNRLAVRGVIRVGSTEDMERVFVMSTVDVDMGGDIGGGEVVEVRSEKDTQWEEGLRNVEVEEGDDTHARFRSTELGKAACGKRCEESRMASRLSTQLTFFPGGRKNRLQLRVSVGPGPDAEDSMRIVDDEEGGEDAKEVMNHNTIDMRFSQGENKERRYRKQKRKSAVPCDMEKEDDATQLRLREEIEALVRHREHMGLSLADLLQSEVAQGCDKTRLAKAIYQMVRGGNAHRFSIETPGLASSPGEWSRMNGVLYVWHTYTRALQAPATNRVLSVWTIYNGTGNDKLARSVADTILHLVQRSPGVAEWRAVRGVQTRHAGVPARAAADVVFLLVRKGALRRVVLRKRKECRGPFGGVCAGRTSRGVREEFCERFVDGVAVEGQDAEVTGYLHAVAGASAKAVVAEELCEIGKRLW